MIAESTTMIGELETSLGVPTFGFFANWSGEYSVDADEEAGRLLSQAIIERMRGQRSDRVALIVAARGGYPAFADAVLRSVDHLDVELEVLIPCRIDGAAGLIALGADSITLHPGVGIGAVDVGLCVAPRPPLDASLVGHLSVEPSKIPELDESRKAVLTRLAYDRLLRRRQRQMAGRLLEPGPGEGAVDWMLESSLGSGMTVGAGRLRKAGLQVRIAPEPLAEQLEELLDWGRQTLQLFESPGTRFEFSDELETEVEFEPATRVPAAAIVETGSVWLHELDTGSPDPDAPRLQGRWRRWDPEGDRAGGDGCDPGS